MIIIVETYRANTTHNALRLRVLLLMACKVSTLGKVNFLSLILNLHMLHLLVPDKLPSRNFFMSYNVCRQYADMRGMNFHFIGEHTAETRYLSV